MGEDETRAPGWGAILAILVGVALVTGLLLGLLGELFRLPRGFTTAGVGAAVGVVAGMLVARRRRH